MSKVAHGATMIAVLKAIRDEIDERMKATRDGLTENLLDAYHDDGTKSIIARMPDGSPVATITLVEPQDSVVVADEREFAAWVKATYPTEAKPKITMEVNAAWRRGFLASIAAADPPIDPKTGEVVPGLKFMAAEEPRTFQTRFVTGGRDAVAAAWNAGELAELINPSTASELESADSAMNGGVS